MKTAFSITLTLAVSALLFAAAPSAVQAETDCLACHADKTMQDGVGRVAVGANRRFKISGRNGLSMCPALVIHVDLRVACSACCGDVRLVSGTLRILVAEDVVRSVAALAIGRHQQPLLAQRKTMNGVQV